MLGIGVEAVECKICVIRVSDIFLVLGVGIYRMFGEKAHSLQSISIGLLLGVGIR